MIIGVAADFFDQIVRVNAATGFSLGGVDIKNNCLVRLVNPVRSRAPQGARSTTFGGAASNGAKTSCEVVKKCLGAAEGVRLEDGPEGFVGVGGLERGYCCLDFRRVMAEVVNNYAIMAVDLESSSYFKAAFSAGEAGNGFFDLNGWHA